MAAYVAWKPFYSVDDPSLDAQHKQIIEMINELYAAVEQAENRPAPKRLLKRLRQYTMAHFEAEEEVMQRLDYPGLAEHKALHDRLRRRTADLEAHPDAITGRDVLQFMKEWWLEHIQGEDKKYAPYVKTPSRP
jgi:hemerythrin